MDTHYANSPGGGYLAYQVGGSGPIDLVEISNGTLFSIEAATEQPRWQGYNDRLGAFSRLLRFDRRGVGLSDPPGSGDPPSAEQWAADALAVLDAADVAQAVVVGIAFGGLAAIVFAAQHPERTRALVLMNAYACLLRSEDYPIGIPEELFRTFSHDLTEPVADDSSTDDLPLMAPSLASDAGFADWWRRAGHRGASPATARAMVAASTEDVRSSLASITAPTLILHARDNRFIRVANGRYLADHLRGSRYVELPGADHIPWLSDVDFVGEIEEFLTGKRDAPLDNRRLLTVLFTDIVGSTEQVAALGDHRWRGQLDWHDRAVADRVTRFSGRLVKTIGDGALATFESPAQAVRCAIAIRDATGQVGLDVRIGVHTGEVEQRGDDVAGMAVHLAQRVESLAQPGEVLVSRTVADLVVGSGLEFVDRGEHELRGVQGRWLLYAVR